MNAFNVYVETTKTVEEESFDKERSGCSGGINDKGTIPQVLLVHILEGDNDEEGVGVFLPKHMRCASHTFNLCRLLMLARL